MSSMWKGSVFCLHREDVLVPKRMSNGTSPSAKTGMKELFAEPKVKKDGTLSKVHSQLLPSS